MIIGENNLIIGKVFAIISDFSISVFFYIKKQSNYILNTVIDYITKIIPVSTAPPKFI